MHAWLHLLPLRGYHDCWRRIWFGTREQLVDKFLESADYVDYLEAHSEKPLSKSLLVKHICRCVYSDCPVECACPYHTQMTLYVEALDSARCRLFTEQDTKARRGEVIR
jgi:hypothetical protein